MSHDAIVEKLAFEHEQQLEDFHKSSALNYMLTCCQKHTPGLTRKGFYPALITALDAACGYTVYVYATGADEQNEPTSLIQQPVGVAMANVAGSTAHGRGELSPAYWSRLRSCT